MVRIRYTDSIVFSLGTVKTRVLAGFANGLSAICDIVITTALCYYLHSRRTGFRRYVSSFSGAWQVDSTSVLRRTDSMIDRLIVYTVNRGGLTA